MTTREVLVGSALLIVVCAVAAPADAQDAQARATARALFEQGVAAVDRGDLAEAEDRFRRSLAIRDSTSGAFNLAMVLVRRGALVEAQELFRTVASADDAPADVRAEARRQVTALEPRIARITVRVDGDAEGLRLRLDERALAPAMLGVPLPVDPGARTVVAERAGRPVFERTVRLAEGGAAEVRVAPLDAETAARTVLEGGAVAPAPSPTDAGGSDDAWIVVVVGVLVAGLVAAGIGVGIAVDEGRWFSGNVGPGRVVLD